MENLVKAFVNSEINSEYIILKINQTFNIDTLFGSYDLLKRKGKVTTEEEFVNHLYNEVVEEAKRKLKEDIFISSVEFFKFDDKNIGLDIRFITKRTEKSESI